MAAAATTSPGFSSEWHREPRDESTNASFPFCKRKRDSAPPASGDLPYGSGHRTQIIKARCFRRCLLSPLLFSSFPSLYTKCHGPATACNSAAHKSATSSSATSSAASHQFASTPPIMSLLAALLPSLASSSFKRAKCPAPHELRTPLRFRRRERSKPKRGVSFVPIEQSSGGFNPAREKMLMDLSSS